MLRKTIPFVFLLCIVAASFQGCTSTKEVIRRSELDYPKKTGPIRVLTENGSLYELTDYLLTDSLLTGTGYVERGGQRKDFRGQLNISDIEYIQTSKISTLKSLVALGAVVFVGATASAYLDKKAPFSVQEHHWRYSPGDYSGSCPFLYTYDGSRYHFESETFAGAIFKGAERASYDVLYHLRSIDGTYRLKVTNERPETDYINEITLLVIDSPSEVSVIPDGEGGLHTVSEPVFPKSCVDLVETDVLDKVRYRDGDFWESDLASKNLMRDTDLRDGLVLEFPKPSRAKLAKVIVNGVNTPLAIFALDQLFKLRGENLIRWYQCLDNDPVEGGKVIDFMRREGMLRIQVWHEGGWVEGAALLAVGPVMPKDQIALIDVERIRGEVMRIRLESATDLWRIDQIYVDYSPDAAVTVEEIVVETAVDGEGNDVAPLLCHDDDLYYVGIPDHYADLTFDEIPLEEEVQRSYVVRTKGYYLKWCEARGEDRAALADKILTEPLFASRLYMPLWRDVKSQYE